MKINSFKILLWAFALLLLAGCSMRPLSAGAFMEAYQSVNDSSKTVLGLSVTGMRAFTSNSEEPKMDSIGNHVYGVKDESVIDISVPIYHFIDHFAIGGGFQYFTPFVSLGVAFDHFGVMGWGTVAAGGISAMEQISPTEKLHVGLFQFASRSKSLVGCKEDNGDCGEFFGVAIDYFEFGGGTYLMYKTGFKWHLGAEFRYSYDIDYKANRFAFTLNLLGL
ncbi:hypothetical protein [Fibrobacter sp.]|uniref:hypothetical protein n=1 Tax=Fibrobacter sp. TaxID=35828 RepID=UPI00386D1CE7